MNVANAHLIQDNLPRVNPAIDRYIASRCIELTTFVQTCTWFFYADHIKSFSGKR